MILSNQAAIYLRLSRDDGNTESESISSQRMLLMQYAEAHEINVSAEFVDDGISGSRFDRAGLQEMLRAIEDGWISIVLVKDLSRLSRDYIRTGELIERWFPERGVRLIAVNDAFDSQSSVQGTDFSAMRAVMDDWYARDISHKVRAAIAARQRAGLCTAARLPYGYCRNNDTISIQPQQASIVRTIFAECCKGLGCTAIARGLNAKAVAPPSGRGEWHDTAVRRILCNTAYIGELRLHTTQTHSYKCRKRYTLPDEDAVIFHIPALVSTDMFHAAQSAFASSGHHYTARSWLSGRAFCALCGHRMTIAREGHTARLLCSGRKSGISCDNPSYRADHLFDQLKAALSKKQIRIQPENYPLLIERMTIGHAKVDVYLRYDFPKIDVSV